MQLPTLLKPLAMRRTFLISRIILVSTVKWLGCDHLGSMRCRKTLLNNSLQYFWLNSTRLDVGIMKREFTWSSGRKNGSGKSGIYEECLGWDLFYCFLEGSVPRHIVGLRWLLGLKYIFFFVSFLQSMRCLFFCSDLLMNGLVFFSIRMFFFLFYK